MRSPVLIALCLSLAGCAGSQGADFPKLVPMETLLGDEELSPDPAPELEARAAALRARAEALRQAEP